MEDREIRVVRHRLPPLYVREGDIVDKESEHILACCYYCHDNYIPVPMADYSQHVVYNCGCHKEPMSDDRKFLMTVCITVIVLLGIFYVTLMGARS